MSLASRSLNNSLYSFFGYVFPLVFSIVVTPILVHKLGSNQFGIFILANTIMGFLNLVDLGVGQAVLKFFSEHQGENQSGEARKVFEAANSVFWSIGVLGIAVFGIIGAFFLGWFKISSQSHSDILVVFLLTGVIFLINSLMVVQAGALKALQRYDITVKISALYVTLYNILGLTLVLSGYQLKALMAANAASACIAFIILLYYSRKYYPSIATLRPQWHWGIIRSFYRFGGAVFVTNIANNALAQIDRLLIPVYYNPTELSYYTIPGAVAEKINGVVGTSTGFLFPMFSTLSSQGEQEKNNVIYQRIIRNVIVLAAGMALVASLFARKILLYWVGNMYAERGSSILVILSVTSAILALYSFLQNTLLGMGQVRFLMKQSVGMAVVNIILLIVLLPRYGIVGAAWAYLGSVIPVFAAVWWAERHIFALPNRAAVYIKLLGKLVVVGGLTAAFYFGIVERFVLNLGSLIIAGPVVFVVFLGLYYVFNFFEPEDVAAYKTFIQTTVGKFVRI